MMSILIISFWISFAVSIFLSLFALKTLQQSKVSLYRKLIAYNIDVIHLMIKTFLHIAIILLLVDIVLYKHVDIVAIVFLNIAFFIICISFFLTKMCSLTYAYNKLLNIHPCHPFNGFILDRIKFARQENMTSDFTIDNPNCQKNTNAWIKAQVVVTTFFLILNMILLIHLLQKR